MKTTWTFGIIVALWLSASLLFPGESLAHCDTLDGPVVGTARAALEKGDITPVLKWVQAEDEKEIRDAFARTLAVRAKGPEAKELADMYFFETLVRVHRAGENAPYTGLKGGETVDPAVALADQALAGGNAEKLVDVLTGAMAEGIKERFQHALAAKKHADDSVAAGREFVEAYVVFTHYVEGLHGLITSGAALHHEGEKH